MLKIIISICAQTLPFAAKTSDVTPISAAARVRGSGEGQARFEMSTIVSYSTNRSHSFLVSVFIGLVILLYTP